MRWTYKVRLTEVRRTLPVGNQVELCSGDCQRKQWGRKSKQNEAINSRPRLEDTYEKILLKLKYWLLDVSFSFLTTSSYFLMDGWECFVIEIKRRYNLKEIDFLCKDGSKWFWGITFQLFDHKLDMLYCIVLKAFTETINEEQLTISLSHK